MSAPDTVGAALVQALAPDQYAAYEQRIADREAAALDDDCRYPVLVSTTSHYVVWVEGNDLKDAAARLAGDGEWYEALTGEHPRDYDYDIAAPDEAWDWHRVYEQRQGPADYCPLCDRYSYDARPLLHKDDCPKARRATETGGAAHA
ncbi:hypothetical protein [Streptomyces sp. NPDC021224]|uniref:hypothetical protein n=1 Tax=unclassified Streptomyces TaxID=2593676 RepID=UPI003799B3CC